MDGAGSLKHVTVQHRIALAAATRRRRFGADMFWRACVRGNVHCVAASSCRQSLLPRCTDGRRAALLRHAAAQWARAGGSPARMACTRATPASPAAAYVSPAGPAAPAALGCCAARGDGPRSERAFGGWGVRAGCARPAHRNRESESRLSQAPTPNPPPPPPLRAREFPQVGRLGPLG